MISKICSNNKLLLCGLACILLAFCFMPNGVYANAKSCEKKNVKLVPGEKYNLKYKKTYTYKYSNKKVATVNKKGKVTAKSNGKCVVKVYKKKKCVIKYCVLVDSKRQESDSGANERPSLIGTQDFYTILGGVQKVVLDRIEYIDERNVNLYFVSGNDDGCWDGLFVRVSNYKYLKIINCDIDINCVGIVEGEKYELTMSGRFELDGECVVIDRKDINLWTLAKGTACDIDAS